MANCEYYLELMSQSLDGELTDQAQQALQEHLDQCADCRFLFQQLCEVQHEFSSWQEQEVPEGFTQVVMDRVRELEQQSKQPKIIPLWKRSRFKALGSIAACALLCLGVWQTDLLRAPHSADTAAGTNAEVSAAPADGISDFLAAASEADPQAKLTDVPAANAPLAAAEMDAQPQAFSLEQNELPDSTALIQSVTDALGAAPGALLVLEEIPGELEGIWYATADGRAFLAVRDEDRAALFTQLSPAALLALSLGDGPLVLLHWS